jgi:hypothetical protein
MDLSENRLLLLDVVKDRARIFFLTKTPNIQREKEINSQTSGIISHSKDFALSRVSRASIGSREKYHTTKRSNYNKCIQMLYLIYYIIHLYMNFKRIQSCYHRHCRYYLQDDN